MKLTIAVQPWYATLMSVIDAILTAYQNPKEACVIYGGSGYGFFMSIERELCPSGPYNWKMSSFCKRVEMLGITMREFDFLTIHDPLEKRMEMFLNLKDILDEGYYPSLLNWEYQVIYGYEKQVLLCASPWKDCKESPPEKITFPNWEEWEDHGFAKFFEHKPSFFTVGEEELLKNSLYVAYDQFTQYEKYCFSKDYACGTRAYDYWEGALRKGFGTAKGNHWNATVWAECRARVSEYLSMQASLVHLWESDLKEASKWYQEQSEYLLRLKEEGIGTDVQIQHLRNAQKAEQKAMDHIERLLHK